MKTMLFFLARFTNTPSHKCRGAGSTRLWCSGMHQLSPERRPGI